MSAAKIGDAVKVKAAWSCYDGKAGRVTVTRTGLLPLGVTMEGKRKEVWFDPTELEVQPCQT